MLQKYGIEHSQYFLSVQCTSFILAGFLLLEKPDLDTTEENTEEAQLQEKSQIISFKLLKNPSFAIFLMSEAILFIGYFMVFPFQGGFLEMSGFG